MPGACKECGRTDVYWKMLDEGVSDELYRCPGCGHVQDFPDTADTDVMRSAKEISTTTGATMIMEIDQSNHPLLASLATGKFTLASSGVCAMMTAHWIVYYFKYSKEEAASRFKDLVQSNIKTLVTEQTVYMMEMSHRSKLAEDFENARAAYKELTGGTTHPDKLPPPMGVGGKSDYIDLGRQEERKALWDKAILCQNIMNDAYQMEIKRMSLNCAVGTEVFAQKPIATLCSNLSTQSKIPALYAINLSPVSGGLKRLFLTGSLSETGHVFGVQIDPPRYRLMDPNTGLWTCDSQETLMELLKAHLEKVYDRVGMFKSGSFTAWRF